jgi:hypothetical protein
LEKRLEVKREGLRKVGPHNSNCGRSDSRIKGVLEGLQLQLKNIIEKDVNEADLIMYIGSKNLTARSKVGIKILDSNIRELVMCSLSCYLEGELPL